MTRPASEVLARHSELVGSDRRGWQDWERALRHFAGCNQEVERARAAWGLRVAKSMRGVDPETWWRYHCRIAAGDLWVAQCAKARRVQRIVQVTGPAVLNLMRRRDDDLRQLLSARSLAGAELRAASQGLVAALGVDRVASVLDVSPAVARSLCSGDHMANRISALLPKS